MIAGRNTTTTTRNVNIKPDPKFPKALTMGKVLIIDDEVDLCMLMKTFFRQKNYEVELAHTLNDGLSKLTAFTPDIIFLDNNLPDGLGWDIAQEILQNHPKVKLNLISAYHPNLPHVKITPNLRIWEKPISLKAIDSYLKA